MRRYFLEGLEKAEHYQRFLQYAGTKSNAFSLVYFRHTENEAPRGETRRIRKSLSPYLLKKKRTNCMPSMITRNDNDHIYELVFYRLCPESIAILSQVDSIMDWDYPYYPMDLCFFKDGYAWFVSSPHEDDCHIFADDYKTIRELQELGLEEISSRDVDVSPLFFESATFISPD